MTLNGRFVSVTRRLSVFAKYKDTKGLATYLNSDEFWEHLIELGRCDPKRGRMALMSMVEASSKCKGALDAKAPIPAPGQSKRVSWTSENISRLQKAWRKGGKDGAARELGISLGAAHIAGLRYVPEARGAHAT